MFEAIKGEFEKGYAALDDFVVRTEFEDNECSELPIDASTPSNEPSTTEPSGNINIHAFYVDMSFPKLHRHIIRYRFS